MKQRISIPVLIILSSALAWTIVSALGILFFPTHALILMGLGGFGITQEASTMRSGKRRQTPALLAPLPGES
jgi:hypothetical protein